MRLGPTIAAARFTSSDPPCHARPFHEQSQGTFLDGKKLEPNKPKLLTDKSSLTFGTCSCRHILSCDASGAKALSLTLGLLSWPEA